MTKGRYALVVLGVVAATLAAAWPVVRAEARAAVLLGAALAAANTIAAFTLTVWSMGRSANVFLGAVLGGMVARMGVMLAAFAAAAKLFSVPALPLAVSVLSYFVAFLVFELVVLHRRTSSPRVPAR
jgi:hypothetical protein